MHDLHGDHDQRHARGNEAALGGALRELYQRRLDVSADRDMEIRRSIAAHFAAERAAATASGSWWARHASRWGIAAAAAIVIAGSLWMIQPRPRSSGPGATPPVFAQRLRGDIDGSGAINILDAFGLARRLDAGDAAEPAFDLNGDGVIDRRDVDVIAMQAVSLHNVPVGGAGS